MLIGSRTKPRPDRLTPEQHPECERTLRQRAETQDQPDQRRGQLRDKQRARRETSGEERVSDRWRRDARTKEQITHSGEEEPKEDERDHLDATVSLDHADALDDGAESGERQQRERDERIPGSEVLEQHDREDEVHRVRDEGERQDLEAETR